MVCTQAELTEQRNAAEAEIDLLEKRREEAVQACMRVQSELREAKDNKEYHQASTWPTILPTSFQFGECCCNFIVGICSGVTCESHLSTLMSLVSSFICVQESSHCDAVVGRPCAA